MTCGYCGRDEASGNNTYCSKAICWTCWMKLVERWRLNEKDTPGDSIPLPTETTT